MAAASVMSSLSLKPTPFTQQAVEKGSGAAVRGLPSLTRTSSPFRVEASGKKIKTDKPYGLIRSFFHDFIYACVCIYIYMSIILPLFWRIIIIMMENVVGIGGGMKLEKGVDASGRKGKVGWGWWLLAFHFLLFVCFILL